MYSAAALDPSSHALSTRAVLEWAVFIKQLKKTMPCPILTSGLLFENYSKIWDQVWFVSNSFEHALVINLINKRLFDSVFEN